MRAWRNSASIQLRTFYPKIIPSLLLLLLLVLVSAASCLMVPLPATRKNTGPNNLQGSTSTDFVRIGATTRADVLEKLGWLSIGDVIPGIFWGRWTTSTSAVAWAGYSGGGKVERLWGGRNVIVEFDENGRVSNLRTFDDPELPREVAAWAIRTGEKLDLTQPVLLNVRHRHAAGQEAYVAAQLSLGAQQFDFSESNGAHNFTLAPSNLKMLELAGFFSSDVAKPESTNITLHFRKRTKAGKHLTLQTRFADLVTLLRYIERVQPQALPLAPRQRRRGTAPQAKVKSPLTTDSCSLRSGGADGFLGLGLTGPPHFEP